MFFPFFYCTTKKHLEKKLIVRFTNSCRYTLPNEDQNDVNKLFGFSYGFHHIDSDRIGWRYNLGNQKIEIVLYSYECGKRKPTQHITWANIDEEVSISISIDFNDVYKGRSVCIKVNDIWINKMYKYKNKWIIYTLGNYFGGNNRAPHTIKIEKKLV